MKPTLSFIPASVVSATTAGFVAVPSAVAPGLLGGQVRAPQMPGLFRMNALFARTKPLSPSGPVPFGIIEKKRKEREERRQENARVPLYAPSPLPPEAWPRDDEPHKDPDAPKRGIATLDDNNVDFTIDISI